MNRSANLPKFFKTWFEKNRCIILMEYCEEDLAKLICRQKKFSSRFKEYKILEVLRDISHALICIHANKIVHLDIKPGR